MEVQKNMSFFAYDTKVERVTNTIEKSVKFQNFH